jgi:hypothetical protein
MSQAKLEALVRQLDPLFESLVGGQPEDRAAIWGQCEQESNANPAAIEKPGSSNGGIGLFQHTSHRRHDPFPNGLEAFAAHYGKPWSDAETQLRFVGQELIGTYAHAWHQITTVATTLRTKTETAMGLFEGPADWQKEIGDPGSTTAGLPRRLQGATWALAVIQDLKRKEKPMSDTSGVGTAVVAEPVDQLAAFIKGKELQLEDLAKAWIKAQWPFVPSPLVDFAFAQIDSKINSVDLVSLVEHVDWSAIVGKLFNKKS